MSELTFHQSFQLSLTRKWCLPALTYSARIHPLSCCRVRCFPHTNLMLHSRPWSACHPMGPLPHGVWPVCRIHEWREIFRLSGIANLLTPDMAIMVDKGFLVDNLVECKVYQLACPSINTHMSREDVRQTQSIARLRVHLVRGIRRVKENKLFDKHIPLSVCGSIEELFNVACYLVKYQNGPLVKALATWWVTLDLCINDIPLSGYSMLVLYCAVHMYVCNDNT